MVDLDKAGTARFGVLNRRGMIRAAGLVGAGGVGVAAMTSGAEAATTLSALQVIDVKAVCGARGDGTTDDTAAIQKALNMVAAPSATPNIVFFPAGDYLVSKPLQPMANTMMLGTHTIDVVADLNPVSQCKIRAAVGFVGDGLIMPGPVPGASLSTVTTGLTIRNLALVGNGVGTNVAGIKLPEKAATKTETGLCLEDVTIGGFSGHGIAGSLIGGALINCHISRNQGWGIGVTGGNQWTDVAITGCYLYFNKAGNMLLDGPGNSAQIEVVNTRFDRAGGDPSAVKSPPNPNAPGIRLTGASLLRFTNCTTDANMGNGVEIIHVAGTSPDYVPNHIHFANCMLTRDGTGNQVSQPDRAGLVVMGGPPDPNNPGDQRMKVAYVTCVNSDIAVGYADDSPGATGVLGPKYGVWYGNTIFFQWNGGDAGGNVASYTVKDFDASHPVVDNYQPMIFDYNRGLSTLPLVAPDSLSQVVPIPEGAVFVDRATSTLKVRVGGAWKSATLT